MKGTPFPPKKNKNKKNLSDMASNVAGGHYTVHREDS